MGAAISFASGGVFLANGEVNLVLSCEGQSALRRCVAGPSLSFCFASSSSIAAHLKRSVRLFGRRRRMSRVGACSHMTSVKHFRTYGPPPTFNWDF